MSIQRKESIQKEFYLRYFKPDFAIGIGFWGNVPEIITEPQKFGITTSPWFNADGWVANYQNEFNKLKLMFTTSQWVKDLYRYKKIFKSRCYLCESQCKNKQKNPKLSFRIFFALIN